jgi:glycosyltransferase involved in cell wall biosynthesis
MHTRHYERDCGGTVLVETLARVRADAQAVAVSSHVSLRVALLTGGQDPHYALGLGTALMKLDLDLEVIGGGQIEPSGFGGNPHVHFRNLHGPANGGSLARRITRILSFYGRLFPYVLRAKSQVLHILWNNRLPIFDRTLLMLFYKLAGKKTALTAHNVNAGRRDNKDSWLNRITLKLQYRLTDHIFVHTNKMKAELAREFHVRADKVTVIPYGINNVSSSSTLTTEAARQKLNLRDGEKAILYFGAIKQYKGLETLVAAYHQIAAQGDYRLVIAGERKKGYEEYWRSVQQAIESDPSRDKVLQKIEFIPDAEIETYFKAADVAVLPYTDIFQSGILFLAYAYGLPVIATDVGSFSEDIVEGRTGFICAPGDPTELANTIQRYFETDLYKELEHRRVEIREYAFSKHSWSVVADLTRNAYCEMTALS